MYFWKVVAQLILINCTFNICRQMANIFIHSNQQSLDSVKRFLLVRISKSNSLSFWLQLTSFINSSLISEASSLLEINLSDADEQTTEQKVEPPPTEPAVPPVVDVENQSTREAGSEVLEIVRRWKMENSIKIGSLVLRGLALVFSFLAFVIMASDKHGDGIEYDILEEYRWSYFPFRSCDYCLIGAFLFGYELKSSFALGMYTLFVVLEQVRVRNSNSVNVVHRRAASCADKSMNFGPENACFNSVPLHCSTSLEIRLLRTCWYQQHLRQSLGLCVWTVLWSTTWTYL